MIELRALAAKYAAKGFAATDAPEPVIIRRTTPGAYNPATGKTGIGTTVDFPCDAIMVTYKQNEIDGTSIRATDRKAIIQQSQVTLAGEVTTGDKMVVDGKALTVVNVGQDAVGCVWFLQVR